MSNSDFKITWIDHHREPQCAPDPRYPDGVDIDASHGFTVRCFVKLPYPARRCGAYYVECKTCGANALITTAGRPDDPRSLCLPCMKQEMLQ
jgi:hypothetical protein